MMPVRMRTIPTTIAGSIDGDGCGIGTNQPCIAEFRHQKRGYLYACIQRQRVISTTDSHVYPPLETGRKSSGKYISIERSLLRDGQQMKSVEHHDVIQKGVWLPTEPVWIKRQHCSIQASHGHEPSSYAQSQEESKGWVTPAHAACPSSLVLQCTRDIEYPVWSTTDLTGGPGIRSMRRWS